MAQSILSAILIFGLLGSGDVCSWLCTVGSAEAAVSAAEMDSHCGDGSPAEPESESPRSHEDCPGCAVDVAASSGPELPVSGLALAAAPGPAWVRAERVVVRPGLAPPRGERSPPRDVLAVTTSLLL